jgi:hypothetical protein
MLAQNFLNPVQEQSFEQIASANPFILPVIDEVLRPLALAPPLELLVRERVGEPDRVAVLSIGFAGSLNADALAQLR